MKKVIQSNTDTNLLSEEHPWPGLRAFTEDNAGFFFGRELEIEDIARKVQQETLTLLFGKSGLGKTSLLRAGLSPLLRESGFVPIYIRLNYQEETLQLEDQVEVFMEEVMDTEGIDGPRPIREETLWEHFHKKDGDWWDDENRLLKPVLIFDQFEEILTSGQTNQVRAKRSTEFLTELGDLVENRPPAHLLKRFKAEKGLAKKYDLERIDYRVILALREDYLADLEGLHERLRMIMNSRYRLLPLNDTQALDVILQPGAHLVDKDVAHDIINFVASPTKILLSENEEKGSESKQVEPALLSIILRELNSHRLKSGEEKISSDLVLNKRPESILSEFYENSLQGVSSEARKFIEQQLLTATGARNRVAEDDAINRHGLTEDLIETLINRRIIQREKTARMSWLELSHDTLTQVVCTSAENFKRIEKRRRLIRRSILSLCGMTLLTVSIYFWHAHERNLQTKEASELALDVALDLENNYTISMHGKQQLTNRLNVGFEKLSEYAGDLDEFKERHTHFLLTDASMQIEGGYFKEASDLLNKAKDILFGQDTESINFAASNLLLARFQLVRAETKLSYGKNKEGKIALDLASNLLETIESPTSDNLMEIRELRQQLNRLKVDLFADRGSWLQMRKIYDLARPEIKAALAEEGKKEEGSNAEKNQKRLHKQKLLSELFKSQYKIIKTMRKFNFSDYSRISTEFEEDLELAKKIFSGDAKRQWRFYRSLQLIGKYYSHRFQNNVYEARDTIDVAIDTLADLVRKNPDNLQYRFHLGVIILNRAELSVSAKDFFQAQVDINTARALAFSLRRDSTHTVSQILLSLNADIKQCKLDNAQKKLSKDSKKESEQLKNQKNTVNTTLSKIEFYQTILGETLDLIDYKLIGYYQQINIFTQAKQTGNATAMADSALSLLKRTKNVWGNGLYANRRYWINESIVTAPTADNIDDEKWKGYFGDALANAEFLIEHLPQDPNWANQKTYLLMLAGNRYYKNKNNLEAKKAFEKLATDCLEYSKKYPNQKYISVRVFYAIQKLFDIYNQEEDWQQLVDKAELLLGHLDSNSGREIWFPTIELKWLSSALDKLVLANGNYKKSLSGTTDSSTVSENDPNIGKLKKSDPLLTRFESLIEKFNNSKQHFEKLRLQQVDLLTKEQKNKLRKLDPKSLDIKGFVNNDESTDYYTTEVPLGWRVPSVYIVPNAYTLMGEEFEETSTFLQNKLKTPKKILRVRSARLSFYENSQLLTVEFLNKKSNSETSFFLRSGEYLYLLNGTSRPIHDANVKFPLKLKNQGDVAAYFRFFCTFIQADGGSFLPVESSNEIPWADSVPQEVKRKTANLIRPITIWSEPEDPSSWYATATVNYSNALFHAKFRIQQSGKVEMVGDMPVSGSQPIDSLQFNFKGNSSYNIDRLYLDILKNFYITDTNSEIKLLIDLVKKNNDLSAKYIQKIVEEILALAQPIKEVTVTEITQVIANYSSVIILAGEALPTMIYHAKPIFQSFIKESTTLLEEVYKQGDTSKEQLVTNYTNLSYFQLLTRDFDGASISSKRAISLDPTCLQGHINLAHSMLLAGQLDQASTIYLKNRDKKYENRTIESYILDDFKEFETVGIQNPGFDEIRNTLKKEKS